MILEAIEVHAPGMRAVSRERITVRSKLSTYQRFFFLLLKLLGGYRWVNPCCHRAICGTKFSWSWSLVNDRAKQVIADAACYPSGGLAHTRSAQGLVSTINDPIGANRKTSSGRCSKSCSACQITRLHILLAKGSVHVLVFWWHRRWLRWEWVQHFTPAKLSGVQRYVSIPWFTFSLVSPGRAQPYFNKDS